MSGDLKNSSDYMIIKYIFLVIFLLVSCRNNSEKSTTNIKPGKNEMADINRYFVQKDRERIQNYIERKRLNLKESPTGFWYQIIKEGNGEKFADNCKLRMEYECSLLDGTLCYTSKKLGTKELVLGKSEMESGMNEALRMLKPGAEAVFIFPSYLAYGILGDRKMIPSRAIIVYNVNILQDK
jgi:FKBP-type peptidyl-prolyl cis-trans isomerase FkpA